MDHRRRHLRRRLPPLLSPAAVGAVLRHPDAPAERSSPDGRGNAPPTASTARSRNSSASVPSSSSAAAGAREPDQPPPPPQHPPRHPPPDSGDAIRTGKPRRHSCDSTHGRRDRSHDPRPGPPATPRPLVERRRRRPPRHQPRPSEELTQLAVFRRACQLLDRHIRLDGSPRDHRGDVVGPLRSSRGRHTYASRGEVKKSPIRAAVPGPRRVGGRQLGCWCSQLACAGLAAAATAAAAGRGSTRMS
jgi:hypothetical protein